MKILTKIYQQNLGCRKESIEIGISEHGTYSFVIATMKGGFFFTRYHKQVK